MSSTQTEAALHSAVMFVGGLIAIAASWAIGALTSHTVSLPVLLVPFTGLIVALLEYVYHVVVPATPPVVTPPPPVTLIVPPLPPTPPAGGS